MEGRPPNVADVARAAGVSLGTVSNVLNKPSKVSPATRGRVEAAILALGFVRNGAARSLAAGTSRTLGFVAADVSNTFFLDLLRGAETVAHEADLNVLLANCDSREDRQRTYLDLFEEERVAGILLAPRQDLVDQVQPLRSRGVHLVVLNADPPGDDVCSVQTDNVHGGELAARHLLEQGRRSLLFAGSSQYPAVVDRLAGARRAIADVAGARLEVLETPGVTIEDGHAVAALLDERAAADRPDAVFAGADMLALGLVQGTVVRGRLRVPQDLAVIGYDNNREAWGSAVPITTLDQAGEEMGRTAATMLLEELDPGRPHQHRRVVLEPSLVTKQSTAAV